MKRFPLAAGFFLAPVLLALAGSGQAEDPPPAPRSVDLVLVLDTSASMGALIDAARDKLSRVITQIATIQPEPDLRLALLTYGTPGGELDGDVHLVSGLTYDFDRVFEALDDIVPHGGHEWVGSALHHAVTRVGWTPGSLRIVFVAGNESADQDEQRPVEPVARRAADVGVRVNAIYCGGADDGISEGWRALAGWGRGRFAHIDHNGGVVTEASPFDKELGALSVRLTSGYRLAGVPGALRMARVDRRVAELGAPLAAERALAKISRSFRPTGVAGAQAAALDALALRIKALGAKRDAHLRARPRASGASDAPTFDRAVREILRTQLSGAGFQLP